jgi:hypothetical protein
MPRHDKPPEPPLWALLSREWLVAGSRRTASRGASRPR